MNDQTIDVVVIGAGPVGENVAQYAHEGGLSVLLVDEELFGGECSYYACMPSKALLRPVDVAHTTRHLQGVSDGSLDSQEMMARRDYWVNNYDDGSQVTWARDTGLEVARGRARIIGEKLVEITPVGEEKSDTDSHASTPYTVHARVAVVLATGSTPVIPPMYEDLQAWGIA